MFITIDPEYIIAYFENPIDFKRLVKSLNLNRPFQRIKVALVRA